ncbi:glutathione S-transferase family protein [Pseudohongiella sp. SYSU M77423]|uniref:glutathione S-transferase family protein n=1 Tax=Pseudohongiella sp. SYSU M77423 TaxID=3042312 RepID=UPI0024812461|nr:glutathione S-transferase family protein [Pseudohongiella sp. SYSU M77423]MDH7943832.1 glutathione S-transferase family protein [Pseudohongiella sp. SYSU M77423]MEC8861286.1 glutathione S-transferase family protein [Pseudomonadota bacterium]
MRKLISLTTVLLLANYFVAAVPAATAQSAGMENAAPMPEFTIYHLEGRRSERLVWLMEELGLPYELEFTRGDLAASMAAIRAINPDMPVAPTVVYDGQVLVESGAIIEMILARHGGGRLVPPLDSPDFATHLMWIHYSEGSLAARAIADYRVWQIQPPTARSPLVDSEAVVQFAENFLDDKPWFGGEDFSAADIMMLFPLNFAFVLNIVDSTQFPNINAWMEKVTARPAYQAMLDKARPDGMIGSLPALPAHAPSGPR